MCFPSVCWSMRQWLRGRVYSSVFVISRNAWRETSRADASTAVGWGKQERLGADRLHVVDQVTHASV